MWVGCSGFEEGDSEGASREESLWVCIRSVIIMNYGLYTIQLSGS